MTEQKRFILLTQNNCPNCERLKRMLAGSLKGAHDDKMTVLHRENDAAAFAATAAEYSVKSTPALIDTATGRAMAHFGIGETDAFLKS